MSNAENPSASALTAHSRRQAWVVVIVLGLTAVLVWLAAATGLDRADANAFRVALDVGVGVAFVGAALNAPAPLPMRAQIGLVGWTWLAGTIVAPAELVHRAVLLVAFVTFPTGRVRGPGAWGAIVAGVAVAFVEVPQGAVALLFLAAAAYRARLVRSDQRLGYAVVGAGGMALALGSIAAARWLDPLGFDPVAAFVGYAMVLLLVAGGFAVSLRAIEDRTALGRRVLRDESLTGLEGLEAVLAEVLGDPSIRVYRWDPAVGRYVGSRGEASPPLEQSRTMLIGDGSEPIGAVVHRAPALDDERTSAAVADAVRLALANLRAQQQLHAQLAELESARARLIEVADQERAAVAQQLRDDVLVRIDEAAAVLRAVTVAPDGDRATEVAVALGELDGASDDLLRLVDGLAPTGLGDGELARVLRAMAARSPMTVQIDAAVDAVGDATAEATLYFACLEAISNAAKHASATSLRIVLQRRGDLMEAVITDDGVGGADVSGSGLQGLADRLAAYGGRLRVESPPGAGTTVVARMPVSQFSATEPASGGAGAGRQHR